MKNKFYRTSLYEVCLCMVLLCLGGIIQATGTYTNPVIPEIGPADPTVLLYDGISMPLSMVPIVNSR